MLWSPWGQISLTIRSTASSNMFYVAFTYKLPQKPGICSVLASASVTAARKSGFTARAELCLWTHCSAPQGRKINDIQQISAEEKIFKTKQSRDSCGLVAEHKWSCEGIKLFKAQRSQSQNCCVMSVLLLRRCRQLESGRSCATDWLRRTPSETCFPSAAVAICGSELPEQSFFLPVLRMFAAVEAQPSAPHLNQTKHKTSASADWKRSAARNAEDMFDWTDKVSAFQIITMQFK